MEKNVKSDKDQYMVTALKDNKPLAYENLYKKYHRYIFAIVSRSLINHDDTEDAVQEIMVKIFLEINKFNPTLAIFKTWITRISTNHSKDVTKSKAYKDWAKLDNLDNYKWSALEGFFTSIAEEKMTIEMLFKSANQEEKTILTLAYLQGYTHPEIAKLLDKSLGSVKTKIYQAIRKIRKNNPETCTVSA